MIRKILLITTLIAFSSTPVIIGCTSSEEKTEAEKSAVSDDGLDATELSEGGASPTDGEAATLDGEAKPVEGDDIVADLGDDLGGTPEGEAKAEALPDQAMGDQPPADQPGDIPPTDTADANIPPPAESMDTTTPDLSAPPMEDLAAAAPKASLKKIKDTPYKSHGRILNTVYVARKGDNLNKVAEKTLGDKKRKKDLIADNSFLSRGVKEGDKIYYNSPRRPDDITTMMTYYEDNGIPAQTYMTKDGDDIKAVAKELLGSKDAWKELWTTNAALESKGALTAGTELRYWTAAPTETIAENAPPPVAAGTIAPPQVAQQMPPPQELPPPPPPPAPEAVAPPPPPQQNAMNELPPPPPPPPPLMKKPAQPQETSLFQDQETTMAIGAGAIILFSVLLIIAHRIKKNKAQRMRLGQTQV